MSESSFLLALLRFFVLCKELQVPLTVSTLATEDVSVFAKARLPRTQYIVVTNRFRWDLLFFSFSLAWGPAGDLSYRLNFLPSNQKMVCKLLY